MATTDPDLADCVDFDGNPAPLEIIFPFTEGTFHGHVVSAIEGGSNYWARIDPGEHQPGWRNYLTARFTITEISDEEAGAIQGQTYELTLDKLKAGMRVMALRYPHHFKDVIQDDGDATTGDVLVQCALFGQIVYG